MDTAIKNHTEITMGSVSYVGMDVHEDTVDMVVMREDSQEPTLEMRIHNERKSIERFFFWNPRMTGSGWDDRTTVRASPGRADGPSMFRD